MLGAAAATGLEEVVWGGSSGGNGGGKVDKKEVKETAGTAILRRVAAAD